MGTGTADGEEGRNGLGDRLRAARARAGWNRETLAFHAGVSVAAIAQLETGRRRNARPGTLSALTDALGVTIDYLVRGTGSPSLMSGHQALVYSDTDQFVELAGRFLAEGVERAEAVLAATTKPHIRLLRQKLDAAAAGVEFVDWKRCYKTPHAALESFTTFRESKLEAGAPWVRILGEIPWSGRSKAEIRRWTRFEALLNLVPAGAPVTILCLYDESALDSAIISQARQTHPETVGPEGLSASPDYVEPSAIILDS